MLMTDVAIFLPICFVIWNRSTAQEIHWLLKFKYRDKNTKAIQLLRDKNNVPDEMEVYVVELELVTDEIDAVEEIEDYPTGEMLR